MEHPSFARKYKASSTSSPLFSPQTVFNQTILEIDAKIFCHQYLFSVIRQGMFQGILSRKGKPAAVCSFMNNVESIFEHLIKRNRCYRVDAKYEWLITSGAADKVGFTGELYQENQTGIEKIGLS